MDAVYNELPVVAPVWSGHSDFVNVAVGKKGKEKPLIASVKYSIEEIQSSSVWEGVIEAGSSWCVPDVDDYKRVLRDVYTNYEHHLTKAKKLSKKVADNHQQSELYKKLVKNILEV